ncbi:MAG: hypothetical protein KatS3mg105_4970 [Gemmatales bacterium]|nr:MAG: hypothetical protein KatS3mg105_4970 [Gemmatales bacterium]
MIDEILLLCDGLRTDDLLCDPLDTDNWELGLLERDDVEPLLPELPHDDLEERTDEPLNCELCNDRLDERGLLESERGDCCWDCFRLTIRTSVSGCLKTNRSTS